MYMWMRDRYLCGRETGTGSKNGGRKRKGGRIYIGKEEQL